MQGTERRFSSPAYLEKCLYFVVDSDVPGSQAEFDPDKKDTINNWLSSKSWKIVELEELGCSESYLYIIGGYNYIPVCSVTVRKVELSHSSKRAPKGISSRDFCYTQEVSVTTPNRRTTPDFLLKKLKELEYEQQG